MNDLEAAGLAMRYMKAYIMHPLDTYHDLLTYYGREGTAKIVTWIERIGEKFVSPSPTAEVLAFRCKSAPDGNDEPEAA